MRFDTITTVLRRALLVGGGGGVLVGVAVGVVGLVVAGPGGLWSGLVGAGLAVVFLGVTAAAILVTNRITRDGSMAGLAVLMIGWFVKVALFIAVMIALAGQPWVVPGVLLAAIIGTVMVSLLVDCVVVATARIPVTDRV